MKTEEIAPIKMVEIDHPEIREENSKKVVIGMGSKAEDIARVRL